MIYLHNIKPHRPLPKLLLLAMACLDLYLFSCLL